MAHHYTLEPNPNRVYTKELRKDYNLGLRNTKWVLRVLPILSVGGLLLGHFGTVWIDPLWGAGLLLLSEFYLGTRFGRLRYRVQDALSNRYRKDFSASVFVGISPRESSNFDGDPSLDVGFLEFGRGVIGFYGDNYSFELLSRELRVMQQDGRSNLIKLEWTSFGNADNILNISVLHSPKERIGKARRNLHHALRVLAHQAPTSSSVAKLRLPPQFVKDKVVTRSRDPSSAPEEEDSLTRVLRVWTKEQLPHLIWKCSCGEVNIRSHKVCRLCNGKQTPIPKPTMPQFEIDSLPSTRVAERSEKN